MYRTNRKRITSRLIHIKCYRYMYMYNKKPTKNYQTSHTTYKWKIHVCVISYYFALPLARKKGRKSSRFLQSWQFSLYINAQFESAETIVLPYEMVLTGNCKWNKLHVVWYNRRRNLRYYIQMYSCRLNSVPSVKRSLEASVQHNILFQVLA